VAKAFKGGYTKDVWTTGTRAGGVAIAVVICSVSVEHGDHTEGPNALCFNDIIL
jgi:hypothetical protein